MPADTYEQIWTRVWERVKTYENIAPSQIDAFFSRLHPQAFSEGFLMLTADNDFIKSWVDNNFTPYIAQALEDEYEVPFQVAIEVDTTAQAAAQASPAPAAPAASTLPAPKQEQPTPSPSEEAEAPEHAHAPQALPAVISGYTFENFVTGRSNNMAYSSALTVAETPGDPQFNPLFIYGRSGLGKTHLLRAAQNYLRKNSPHLKTIYVDTLELVDALSQAARNKAYDEFNDRYKTADVLMIDDVQSLQRYEGTLNTVFDIFNNMIDSGRQVILAADRPPSQIDIDDRYQSRFNSGLTCPIEVPEKETKIGIIQNYVEDYNSRRGVSINLSRDIQDYIAQNSGSNIRELKSAVNKVILSLDLSDQDISINEVAQLLKDHFSGGAMKQVSIDDIQRVVCDYYKVSHAELVGKKRSANIVHARQMAIYLCRNIIDLPYETIGEAFNRDHTTAMYSYNTIDEKATEFGGVQGEIEVLRQIIFE